MSWFRNTITNLCNAVSAPVPATRDALSERLQSVRDIFIIQQNDRLFTRDIKKHRGK